MLPNGVKTCPPDLARGAELREGTFWRNVKKNGVKKRYPDDSGVSPVFGRKFDPRPDKWMWEKEGRCGLSVNITTCVDAYGSAQLHPTPDHFGHVVEIDLAALSDELGDVLLAQYTPVDEEEEGTQHWNPCHFDIVPEEARLQDVLVKLKMLASSPDQGGHWPAKLPRTEAETERALACKSRWDRVFVQIVDL